MIKYTLRQLEFAIAAADAGSVAAAAEKLGVAQPSISAAVKKLEQQIGVQLFVRQTARGVVPSAQGVRFLTEARSLLAHARDVEKLSSAGPDQMHGMLKIGSFHTLAPIYIPPLISRFRKLYPMATIQLEEGDEGHLFEGLRSGRLDLALVYRVSDAADIRMTDVAMLPPQVVLPVSHKLARQSSIALADLSDEPFIGLNIEPSRTYFLRVLKSAGIEPRVAYESSSIELVRAMVGYGMGYSLLITRPAGDRSYDGRKLAVRGISGPVEPGIVSLAALRMMRPSVLAARFEAFATKMISSKES